MEPITYAEIALVPAVAAALARWWVVARRRVQGRRRAWEEEKRTGDRAILEAWRESRGRPRLP